LDDFAPEDIVFEGHGVKILIDPKSLSYIDALSSILCVKA